MAYLIAHVYDDTPGHFGMRVALVNRSTTSVDGHHRFDSETAGGGRVGLEPTTGGL
jgi:hypothetical protein